MPFQIYATGKYFIVNNFCVSGNSSDGKLLLKALQDIMPSTLTVTK
jgi:hypothetical protein